MTENAQRKDRRGTRRPAPADPAAPATPTNTKSAERDARLAPTGLLAAIDIGGTNCRVAIADAHAAVLAEAEEPVVYRQQPLPAAEAEPGRALAAQIARITQSLLAQAGGGRPLRAAGVALPGFVDPDRGTTSVIVNLFGEARDVPFRDYLQASLGVPVWVENDVKTGALGELAEGWGRAQRNFLFLAIGTGTAAAIVLDGRLYRGQRGQAGELAYAITAPALLGEDYGEHGCLESHFSGYGIARRYRHRGGEARTAADVFAARAEGDRLANNVIETGLDHLAVGLSGALVTLDLELLVLGGSIGLRPDVQQGLAARLTRCLPHFSPRVEASRLGSHAQRVGALHGALSLLP